MLDLLQWCFTVNNWTPEEWDSITQLLGPTVKYLCVGKEVGRDGTPHLQGYLELKKRKRLRQRAHLEAARGSSSQAAEYCKKDGDYLEVGKLGNEQGRRTDLEDACRILRDTNAISIPVQASSRSVLLPYYSGLRQYCYTLNLGGRRDFKTKVIVICGPPGCGKTRRVFERVGGDSSAIYMKPRGNWWDGYCGQLIVCLDDFYWIPFDELLRICDRYPLKVQVKGGYVDFISRELYITSNNTPDGWYSAENILGRLEALYRRIDEYLTWDEGLGRFTCGNPMFPIAY
ncbi:Rep [Ursus americanus circovirus]|uniref:Replication-associated protein n=1 Tax=Ursus americanus circovirus TaxID=2736692 RepID=A0A6M5KAK8_9CIRC|nr:Rep [Ursus americanus circovirus]QJU69687.1 Rep [Ursus americanus circovirus]